jgi:hypothetical protein
MRVRFSTIKARTNQTKPWIWTTNNPYLRVAETRPAVSPTLNEKVLHRSTDGGSKEMFSRVGVIKLDGTRRRLCFWDKLGLALKVTTVLGVVPVVVANLISLFHVATPAKILLDGAKQTIKKMEIKLAKEANGFIKIASGLCCSTANHCQLSTILPGGKRLHNATMHRSSHKETETFQTYTAEVPFALGDMRLSSPITHGGGNLGAMIVI